MRIVMREPAPLCERCGYGLVMHLASGETRAICSMPREPVRVPADLVSCNRYSPITAQHIRTDGAAALIIDPRPMPEDYL